MKAPQSRRSESEILEKLLALDHDENESALRRFQEHMGFDPNSKRIELLDDVGPLADALNNIFPNAGTIAFQRARDLGLHKTGETSLRNAAKRLLDNAPEKERLALGRIPVGCLDKMGLDHTMVVKQNEHYFILVNAGLQAFMNEFNKLVCIRVQTNESQGRTSSAPERKDHLRMTSALLVRSLCPELKCSPTHLPRGWHLEKNQLLVHVFLSFGNELFPVAHELSHCKAGHLTEQDDYPEKLRKELASGSPKAKMAKNLISQALECEADRKAFEMVSSRLMSGAESMRTS